jgi:nitroimidazol reductase NimA-like FMN-containing flavoprotein (pyridoxamine 5'-phosphate oxidase superfamily)
MDDHSKEPAATRPDIPGYGILDARSGKGLLPWSWAEDHLKRARNYWIATTRPDGRPHVMPVWGIWVDSAFYFSTGRNSRKARNLESNPNCVICPEEASEAAFVEGVASEISDPESIKRLNAYYSAKYNWDLDPAMGPVYRVVPKVAFGFIETGDDFTRTATRWKF